MSSTPEALKYTVEHEWISIEGSTYTMGITDYAQSALGDIVYVQLPKIGEQIQEGTVCGEVESTKSVSELFAPVSGKVTSVNDVLSSAPESINSDPYGAGWLVKIEVTGVPSKLLSAGEYAALTA
ncbi:MAG: glycine cleavage system protein GcvH [Candidatus Planktophila sp.]|jgi:glycine cleavage system H protein|nr:glycine cleavage system protein GcvH [Candidatus Planktophila sp.]